MARYEKFALLLAMTVLVAGAAWLTALWELPTPYEYHCADCDRSFESFVRPGGRETQCPACQGENIARELSVFASARGAARGRSDGWQRQWRRCDGRGRMLWRRLRLPLNSAARSEARRQGTLTHASSTCDVGEGSEKGLCAWRATLSERGEAADHRRIQFQRD
jgi:putative FmdB family regulatory protein